MTRGQIAQLQELARCWGMHEATHEWIDNMLMLQEHGRLNVALPKRTKAYIRLLWHQYRNQIAAMRKNR